MAAPSMTGTATGTATLRIHGQSLTRPKQSKVESCQALVQHGGQLYAIPHRRPTTAPATRSFDTNRRLADARPDGRMYSTTLRPSTAGPGGADRGLTTSGGRRARAPTTVQLARQHPAVEATRPYLNSTNVAPHNVDKRPTSTSRDVYRGTRLHSATSTTKALTPYKVNAARNTLHPTFPPPTLHNSSTLSLSTDPLASTYKSTHFVTTYSAAHKEKPFRNENAFFM